MTVHNLRELGIDVSVDDQAVERVSSYLAEFAKRKGLPVGMPAEYDHACYRHQVPAGMISTLERQLREIGMQERLAEALEEIPRVRQELGFPIMVTPLSQFVGTQAVMNVTAGQRYKNVSDPVIRYVLGVFGEPPASIDPDVKDAILERSRAKKLSKAGAPKSLDEWRAAIGPELPEEELCFES